MKLIIVCICLFAFKTIGFTQKHDCHWLIGYDQNGIPGDLSGISELSFDEGELILSDNLLVNSDFWHNNASISDSSGQLFAYCNGIQIENADFQIMENGGELDQVIFEGPTETQYYSGDKLTQGCIFLPWPGKPDSLLLVYSGDGFIAIPGYNRTNRNLSYAVVDKTYNGGLGKIVAREIPILQDTLNPGQVTAVKHANGRDWWMLYPEFNSTTIYTILIDPTGVQVIENQTVNDTLFEGVTQSCYAPDGNIFALYSAVSSIKGAWLDVFDFDRCTGTLSNQRHIHYEPGAGRIGGIAFSPNSRFLYHNFYDTVFQYDMYAADLLASRVVVGVRDSIPYSTRFYQAQLAPDGKIYSCAIGSSQFLHIIHNPNQPGTDCQFQQRGLKLPTVNSSSVPNHPNYRLGPLDGSPCDTLGINNHPVAWWRYERDTVNMARFVFRDLSYYEPTNWYWTFGDGASSTERHPEHAYATTGTYNVCLTVSNVNSSNTLCREVFGTVSTGVFPEKNTPVRVGPNPFVERLVVTMDRPLARPVFHLYDTFGRLMAQMDLSVGYNELLLPQLPAGMFVWEVTSGGVRVQVGKVVKGR